MNSSIKILGIGQSVPEKVLTNKDIEFLTPGSNASWIEDKLGIKSRRVCVDEDVVSLGSEAGREALTDSNLKLKDIDLLIVNTSSPDKISPSVACMIQNRLGLTCPSFDINAVCTGFIYALDLSSQLLDKYKNILIISTETYSKITDWKNYNSCFFGDGAASVVISKGSYLNNFDSKIGADGTGWEHFSCDRDSTFNMNGKEVYKFGTKVLPREINSLLLDNNVNINEIDYILPHQPSHNVLKNTATQLNIPESKICFNMAYYGNTAGASVPMALYKSIKNNTIKNGDNLILAAIGSGWTYGVAFLKLEYK